VGQKPELSPVDTDALQGQTHTARDTHSSGQTSQREAEPQKHSQKQWIAKSLREHARSSP